VRVKAVKKELMDINKALQQLKQQLLGLGKRA